MSVTPPGLLPPQNDFPSLLRSFHGRVGHVGDCQATVLERVLRHSIKFFNKSNRASTWSAQEYEIMKEREPVAQSKFSNRPETSDNTVDRNLELSNGSQYA